MRVTYWFLLVRVNLLGEAVPILPLGCRCCSRRFLARLLDGPMHGGSCWTGAFRADQAWPVTSCRFWHNQFDLSGHTGAHVSRHSHVRTGKTPHLCAVDLVRDVLSDNRSRQRFQPQNRLVVHENLDLSRKKSHTQTVTLAFRHSMKKLLLTYLLGVRHDAYLIRRNALFVDTDDQGRVALVKIVSAGRF